MWVISENWILGLPGQETVPPFNSLQTFPRCPIWADGIQRALFYFPQSLLWAHSVRPYNRLLELATSVKWLALVAAALMSGFRNRRTEAPPTLRTREMRWLKTSDYCLQNPVALSSKELQQQ